MWTVFHLPSGAVHDWTHALANVENLLDGVELVPSGVGELTRHWSEDCASIETP
ncbi:hypothetical protein [Salinigranum salinum]|uniref:hypothetical protein n=1 Tax=Salinigranum salinum TaxID=1364937 RepID=UPI001864C7F6|nr:hypothetical protein [Salinigranum salinum]